MKIFGIALAVALAGTSAWWFWPDSDHSAEWVNAIGVCAGDPISGAAMISALENLHGWKSWPKELDLDISLCNLKAATLKLQG